MTSVTSVSREDVPWFCNRQAEEDGFAGGKADDENAASAGSRCTAAGPDLADTP